MYSHEVDKLRASPPLNLVQNKNICHDFPQIFYFKIFHGMLFFETVQLTVTAMAWNHDHVRTRCLYLFHFSFAVIYPLLIVSVHKSSSASTTAKLMYSGRIEINPVFKALIHYPARLIKISVAEHFFRLSSVIAGIMVCGADFKLCFVQLYPFLLYIFYKKVEHRVSSEFFQCIGSPFFKTRPGREIRVASFRP